MSRTVTLALVGALLWTAAPAAAQDMNIALSRLRVDAVDAANTPEGTPCRTTFGPDGPQGFAYCQDDDAWRRVMTQLAGSMMPPILTPAGTRGVRGIYIGFETWITGIDNDAINSETGRAWSRAVEGDGLGTGTSGSRFVDDVLAWGRFNVRKGLPFGFELGTSVGYLANTSYWTLGAEVRWSLFEGFREEIGWIPDFAIRGAVQTMLGDEEFNLTVPTIDFILSEPFVVANSVEIIPSIMGQVGFVFADSELVDLNPGVRTFDTCRPSPETPTPGSGSPPYCGAHLPPGSSDGTELNHSVVFPSLRSTRARLGAGLQVRYEWFTLIGSFLFDLLEPGDIDSSLPGDLPRQWQLDLGVGLTL